MRDSNDSSLNPLMFCAGPPGRFERWSGLIRPHDRRTRLRAFLVVLIAWAPLAILAAVHDLTQGGNSLHSFLFDFGAYARYVVAAPLCVLAENFCSPQFQRIILHFRNSGIVTSADRNRYDAIVVSSRRLLESRTVEITSFAIAYALAAIFITSVPAGNLPQWQVDAGHGSHTLSAAGRWHMMISLPLLLVFLLGWGWRHILWTRFLWLLTRLDLQIIPAHSDHCCGLKFLSLSIRGYGPLGFACSAIVAGGIADRIFGEAASPQSFSYLMAVVIVFIVLLFVAPLSVFAPLLRRAQIQAIFEYGALARTLGGEFERKWLPRRDQMDPGALDVSDFSATTDLYSIVANVYSIGYLPLSLRTVEELLVIVALPFIPVVLTAVPITTIFQSIMKVLM